MQWRISEASGHDNDSEACPEVLPLLVSFCFPLFVYSLSLFVSYMHEHTHGQDIFISRPYADSAHEIAGLTPCCKLYKGNIYPNPTEHTINLFPDRRQTRMSPCEATKDGSTFPRPSWQSSH